MSGPSGYNGIKPPVGHLGVKIVLDPRGRDTDRGAGFVEDPNASLPGF